MYVCLVFISNAGQIEDIRVYIEFDWFITAR